jgi:hypothetical protein
VTLVLLAILGCDGSSDKPSGDDACGIDDVDLATLFSDVLAGNADDCELSALSEWTENRATTIGPWKEDIAVAWSADGLDFDPVEDGTIIEGAAVPEVVHAFDSYYLFHVIGNLDYLNDLAANHSTWMVQHGIPGLGALGLAVSGDGLRWSEAPEFSIEGLVQGMVVDPDIRQLPDGTWRMYYVGMAVEEYFNSTWEEGEQHSVYSAVSNDLIHWRQEGEVFRGPYADPSVWCLDETNCVMASFGLDWSTSTDGGATFSYGGHWEKDGFAPEFTQTSDGSIRMFYNSKETAAPLRSYISTDGQTWEPETGTRMDEYGEAVSITEAPDSGYYMYFHTFHDMDDAPF